MTPNFPIPDRCLIVLVGPPGSGKSTWAHQNRHGVVHVSQDDLIDAITPGGFDHMYRSVYRAAEDAVARAALQAGHIVIVDRTNRTRAHRERWLALAREAACPAIAVVMSTSEELCRERNAKRPGNRRVSEANGTDVRRARTPKTRRRFCDRSFRERRRIGHRFARNSFGKGAAI